jgi:GAF domain-containing protein
MTALNSTSTPAEAYQVALNLLKEHVTPERALILYGHDENDKLKPQLAQGFELDEVYTTAQISLGIIEEVLAEGEAKIVLDAVHDPLFGDRVSTLVTGIRSVLCCPILSSSGQAVGLLYADSRDRPNHFKSSDVKWITELSNALAKHLEHLKK